MEPVIWAYLAYVILSLAVIFLVARTLSRTGATFLVDVMDGDREKAEVVNQLLVVGFWLIVVGFVAFQLPIDGGVETARIAIEDLASKLGAVVLVVGLMHFATIFTLSRIRHGRRLEQIVRPPALMYQMPPAAPAPAK